MSAALHVIASCADRKRSGFGEEVQLRDFSQRGLPRRLDQWWKALSADGPRVPAEELYVGPYWSTVRSLARSRASNQFAINVWVASAGYGLVSAQAPVRPYSATFRSNEADSVVRPADRPAFDSRHWWAALCGLRAPGPRAPRSLTALAKANPRERLLVLGSVTYVAAMEDDLVGALGALRSPDSLIIVCGEPGPKNAALRECWIQSDSRLVSRVGGSLPALHARVALRILNDSPRFGLSSRALRQRWAAIAERSPAAMKPQRIVSTDEQVKEFVRAALKKDPAAKHSRLLREFRADGRACEQSRFRDLFQAVAKERST